MLKMNIFDSPLMRRITGARQGELPMILASFASLLCLQSSYYLVKPLRNSQFLKEFPPEFLPVVYLVISLLSFGVTKIYSHLYGRLDRGRILTATFLVVCLCKLFFSFSLVEASRGLTILFYLWGSVYFLLVLSAIWGCINDIFRADQSERCFGFVATGSTLGCIWGSYLATNLSFMGPKVLLVASFFLLLALASVQSARHFGRQFLVQHSESPAAQESNRQQETSTQAPPTRGFLSELKLMLGNRYLLSLATMVTCLAIYTTGVDFTSQQQMDRSLAELAYGKHLSQFGPAPNSPAFKFVRSLRGADPQERASKILEFAGANHLTSTQAQELAQGYDLYKKEVNERTQSFFASTNLYQGLCGALVLTFVCPWLFRNLGMSVATMIFPVFALAGLAVFTVPLSVEVIQFLLVVGGTLNYNLNNATKEVLYTVTTSEEKYRIKPMIEGPCMRMGDMIASVAKLALGLLVIQAPGLSPYKDNIYLLMCGLCVCLWIRAIWWASGEYSERRLSGSTPQA